MPKDREHCLKLKKEQSDVKKKLIKEIDHVNTETQLTTSMIDKLKGNADNMVFQAEKRISLGNTNA